MTKALSPYLETCTQRINQHLNDLFLHHPTPCIRLREAMQYSTLAGGKRIRALLIYATGHAFHIPLAHLDACAKAVELIHTYSLIHDDLPAMDNDDLRRGKPTCHKAFDTATAILAGDALQTLAFEQLAEENKYLTPLQQLRMITVLAQACGLQGMAGGQALDLASVGEKISLDALQTIHQLKTGALISACIHIALLASNTISATQIQYMHDFAEHIGLAFQIQDDLLDVIGDKKTLGKPTHQDAARDKLTYPAIIGIEASTQLLHTLMQEAATQLNLATASGEHLLELTRLIVQRQA
ncbi:MAG TPA: farnesyl diphosphate synthase [Gammaproteobacteria bacterium]|nr:farnesyl diphosphate synthase [Gammaproteobacteria bacterium]